ncbi:sensor histidine kinase [Thiobacillus denitrificans]|uniref:sensor histidine kinase n=1 Tax=Thiobacillus denitrificans TaxID=36861 RepID=UPI0009EC9C67|nr:PhnD/SsuA/transferrin family substrate-binding protein [Thiobacillus denitrificans]
MSTASVRGHHRRILFLAVLVAVLARPPAAHAQAAPPVRIGVLAFLGVEVALSTWSPLVAHIEASLPARRVVLTYYDVAGLRQAVQQQALDFVITNSGQYAALESEFGVSRIATLESPGVPSPSQAIGSAVIVRADRRDLNVLADLKGERVAAVGEDAFGGFQVAWREFRRQGVEPGDFARLDFVGFPMPRIVTAVARGQVDAGIVRACLLEDLARDGAIRLADFKVLSPRQVEGFACGLSSDLYPDWPLATLRHTDLHLAKAVATALLSMPVSPTGYAWTVPADYQAVHELFRDLQIGPYAYLRETTLQALARRYWPFLLLFFAALAGWIVHAVRVEQQVHARTAALRQALAQRDAAEAGMRAHQEQFDHLSRLSILGELSGTLAHELNQPLAAIANYAQSLVRRLDSGRYTPAILAEASREIAAQAARAGGIVHRIRAFARKRAAVRERRPLAELVREAAALFGGMLPGAPRIDIADRLPPGTLVEADTLQVEQVLLNLLKNAADAMQDLPPAERAIDVTLEQAGHHYRIAIRDQGVGLAPASTQHLFEPFFTTKPDGMGLGLSICKTIVEAHGGRLWAEAHADAPGMTFIFTLPADDPTT